MTPTGRLRAVWERGGCGVNLWLTNPAPFAAETLCRLDWDSVVIDMQHSPIELGDAIALLTAIDASGSDSTPLVRVPWNDPPTIMKVLDAGAQGVICPSIRTRADVEQLVAACRYPPAGIRSIGPFRAGLDDQLAYFDAANGTVLAIAQIETAEAYESLDEVLSTPGLDAIYIGNRDLAISLGHRPVIDHADPEAAAVTRTIIEAARRQGIPAGLHVLEPEQEEQVVAWGAALITPGNDIAFLSAAALQSLDHVRRTIGARG